MGRQWDAQGFGGGYRLFASGFEKGSEGCPSCFQAHTVGNACPFRRLVLPNNVFLYVGAPQHLALHYRKKGSKNSPLLSLLTFHPHSQFALGSRKYEKPWKRVGGANDFVWGGLALAQTPRPLSPFNFCRIARSCRSTQSINYEDNCDCSCWLQ